MHRSANVPVTTRELVTELRATTVGQGVIERLKIAYRPYICPFDDLIRRVRPGAHVVDIGCGSGQFALLLAQFSSAASVHGIEVDDRLVANATKLLAERAPGFPATFEKYDPTKGLPESVARAEQVFVIDVLHHVPPAKQQPVINQLRTLVGPGTLLVLKDIDAASPLVFANKLHDVVLSRDLGREVKADTAKRWVTAAGFRVVEVSRKRTLVYPHYLIEAEAV